MYLTVEPEFPCQLYLVIAVPRFCEGSHAALDYEWRNLDSTPLPPELKECGIIEVYEKLAEITDNEGTHQFKV